MINHADEVAVYLEVGTRAPADLITCSDIDMMSSSADGAFRHKDGRPYQTIARRVMKSPKCSPAVRVFA
jgi:uncharacterized cupin superfamily protein